MDNIQVGDMVMWYEENHKKTGQVFGIDGDIAEKKKKKDCAVYKKPLNRLKKIS